MLIKGICHIVKFIGCTLCTHDFIYFILAVSIGLIQEVLMYYTQRIFHENLSGKIDVVMGDSCTCIKMPTSSKNNN